MILKCLTGSGCPSRAVGLTARRPPATQRARPGDPESSVPSRSSLSSRRPGGHCPSVPPWAGSARPWHTLCLRPFLFTFAFCEHEWPELCSEFQVSVAVSPLATLAHPCVCGKHRPEIPQRFLHCPQPCHVRPPRSPLLALGRPRTFSPSLPAEQGSLASPPSRTRDFVLSLLILFLVAQPSRSFSSSSSVLTELPKCDSSPCFFTALLLSAPRGQGNKNKRKHV